MVASEPKPDRVCDMVMKGGITSGIVYPLAVTTLAEKFVFKNIGGTSAGAIAAAATAAAELARDTGGFEQLSKLPTFLSSESPGRSGSNLFAFFQPQRSTARLFRVCVAGLGGGWKGALAVCTRIVIEFWPAVLIGVIPGAAFLGLSLRDAHGLFRLVCEVVGIFLLALGAVVTLGFYIAAIATRALPRNFYGLCSGMTDEFAKKAGNSRQNGAKPLTVWLTEYLNKFVNRTIDKPHLTFGELWGNNPQDPHRINLEMMTTCLTHGRPYRLPFRDDAEVRENRFYFRPDEFQRLFPRSIVNWMVGNPRRLRDSSVEAKNRRDALKERGFCPLPEPADLPVVVAVRMSLSFPILLSAVPLYDFDRSRDPKGVNPERCWFSDGGVCSNFPLHFFDSPFPRWPTLGIDLRQMAPGTDPEEFKKPQMVRTPTAGIQENWNRFEFTEKIDQHTRNTLVIREKSGLGKLTSFAGAFIATMQNWSDNTLSRLPGYRDRIRPVPLSVDEGGLNLNMPSEVIIELTKRGVAAGQELIDRFSSPPKEPKMNWDNHRWVRMRSSLASIEAMLVEIDRACEQPQSGDKNFESWIATVPPEPAPSYAWKSPQQHVALNMIKGIRQIVAECKKIGVSVADGSPRPRGELRRRAHI